MTMQTYPSNDNTQLSPHFCASEFACKCGKAHTFQIADELIAKLEQLYDSLECSKIIVTSGYRCPEHDRAVGGNGSGQHTKGTAADVICYNCNKETISSKLVSCAAQEIGFTGIANIDAQYDKTHLDIRTSDKWYGNEIYGNKTITDDFYRYYNLQGEDSMAEKAYGIDVSYAQGKIDWEKVKTSGKVDFAILRAGYGREYSQVDKQFERNYSECKRLGIPCGVYWFSYAMSVAEAEKEAQVFLDTIKGKQFEYPIYMDLEVTEQFALGKATCSAMVDAFLTRLEKAGYFAGLYCSTNYLNNYISDSIKSRYAIWVAQYNKTCTYKNPYGIWQYNIAGDEDYDIIGQGSIPGISGKCDMDYAYIDYPTIIKQAGLNGFTSAGDSDKSDKTDNSKTDTLEQILQHVANIDEKLKYQSEIN